MTYPVAERFVSINGEGRCAGQLALFLRFPGCNLACSYCDTAWVNEAGAPVENLEVDELLREVENSGVRHLTVTGGEPLLQPNIAALLSALSDLPSIQVEVETNGSVDLEPFMQAAPRVCFTMDYKLPYSGMEAKMHLGNLALLRETDCLKFVCGSRADLQRAKELIEAHQLDARVPVYLSPVFGTITADEMVTFMKEEALVGVRLQLQLHKFIWPPEMRGV